MSAFRTPAMCISVLFLHVLAVQARDTRFDSLSAQQWPRLIEEARKGDHRAQTRVGIAYARGEIVEQDFSKAVEWFLQAATFAEHSSSDCIRVITFQSSGHQENSLDNRVNMRERPFMPEEQRQSMRKMDCFPR